MFTIIDWRHPRTGDGRLTIFGFTNRDSRPRERNQGGVVEFGTITIIFSWLPAPLNADKIMHAMVSLRDDLKDGQGLLPERVLAIIPIHSIPKKAKKLFRHVLLPYH